MCKRKITIGAFALLAATQIANADEPPSAGYQSFPIGYGYMQENEALAKAVKQGNHKVVRQHGWKLWAGIMQAAQGLDWPVWYTWPNTKAAFADPGKSGLLGAEATELASKPMIKHNQEHVAPVNESKVPVYPIPEAVIKAYPNATSKCGKGNICDGSHVLFNGDIMIPTESLSQEAMDWIRNSKQPLYKQATLDKAYEEKVHMLEAPQRHIVTKHMYWPVKATGLSAIPVWHDDFKNDYTGYAGYENWKNLVAVDPSGKQVGTTQKVAYRYGVLLPGGTMPMEPAIAQAKVHGLDEFYYHKVTKADWDSFDEADKAIINASSYWAYNQSFGPGDYLVTVAMHVNTKEIPSWALQSVWWTNQPDTAPYAADRPKLPQAKGPWDHYLLVDSYGISEKPNGDQPVAMNPYIELVIHPVATNCNNCHVRAGWPTGNNAGQASYQNPDCTQLLATLTPDSMCLKKLTLTDFQWTIPDRAVK
ncbi:MAG: hypothetical protein ACXV74_03870 [Methylobacter sp.]